MLVPLAARFYADLEQDNSRDFWLRERARYDDEIAPAFAALLDEVTGLGPWRRYRPHNNRRFQRDAAPYKTFAGAVAERPDGVGVFLQLSRRGLLVGTGVPQPAPDQLAALRAAIADDDSGVALVEIVARVRQAGVRVHHGRWDPLVRVPRGYPATHARADLLRWKGLEANSRLGADDERPVAELGTWVRAVLAAHGPVDDWLGRWVGPSALTPEERFAPRRARSR